MSGSNRISAVAVLALFCLFASLAKADVMATGSTSGALSILGSDVGNPLWFGNPLDPEKLTFQGGTFSEPLIEGQTVDLGTFSLSRDVGELEVYTADLFDFTLIVTFTAPPGIPASPFTAALQGQAQLQWLGDKPEYVEVEFNNPSTVISYGGGSFRFTVDDLQYDHNNAIFEGKSSNLVGHITEVGTVPDGGLTVALLGVALVGLESLRRRFRA
jgi:hypothetical protein